MMPSIVELVRWHAAATWFMTGVIWFVQLVHYPLMGMVGKDRFVQYEEQHQRRTTWIVAPVMLFEAATAIALLLSIYRGGSGGQESSFLVRMWIAFGLLAIAWVSTFLVQVPIHQRLSQGFDLRLHTKLVQTNWLRTAAWSARAVLIGSCIH